MLYGIASSSQGMLQLMSVYEILDGRFKRLIKQTERLELLSTGCRWAEGPAYQAGGRYVVWSDIPNNRMMRYDEIDGHVGVFRAPSQNSNGNTIDRVGRLATCEHRTRCVTRTEHDGTITILADRYNNKRLNSPNDLVVTSDDAIWFTDPTYGIQSDYEGLKGDSEIGSSNVYRIEPKTGAVVAVVTDFIQPNGLAFSVDETRLYIADSGRTEGAQFPAHIRVFDVGKGGKLTGGRVFAECENGVFDGFRVDEDGRIWASTATGIDCYEVDGTLIGRIRVPEVVSNCVFGGLMRNRLFITATTSLYSVYVTVRGVKTY